MTTQDHTDVSISGRGTLDGGMYHRVSISGMGQILGDIEADSIHIAGKADFAGSLKARQVESAGKFDLAHDLECETFSSAGKSNVHGDARIGQLRVAGKTVIKGKTHAQMIEIMGVCEFGRDVEAAAFRSAGRFNAAGMIAADDLEIALAGESQASEIGGEKITIVKAATARDLFQSKRLSREALLSVGSIEGDRIFLESTHVRTVRGDDVQIGAGCEVQEVEYKVSLTIDPKAKVANAIYTGQGAHVEPVTADVQAPDGWARQQRATSCSCLGLKLGDWSHIHPALKIILAIIAVVIAIKVIGLVLAILIPVLGLLFGMAAVVVVVFLVAMLIGIPFLVFGGPLFKLLMLPVEIVLSLFRKNGGVTRCTRRTDHSCF